MKTGKRIPLVVDSKFKSHIGTVDSKNLKSLYIQFSSWVEPVSESSCWGCVVKNFKKSIKTEMSGLINLDNFKPKVIVDLDLRSSGIKVGKRSFMKCEVTLFLNNLKTTKDLKSSDIKNSVDLLTSEIINKSLKTSKDFEFHATKR